MHADEEDHGDGNDHWTPSPSSLKLLKQQSFKEGEDSNCDGTTADTADLIQGDEVFWRVLPKPEEARQHYIDDGSLPEGCSMEHVELRALLDDPISQKLMAKHVKESQLIDQFMCWIDCIEYGSINTSSYRTSKANHIFMKYIDKAAVVPLHKWILDNARIDKETLFSDITMAGHDENAQLQRDFFDRLRDTCFASMYDNFFKAFRETPEYTKMTKAIKRRYNYVVEDDFEYIRKLGHGTYGIVVHCRKKSTGVDYAMKIQLKEALLKSFQDDPRRVEHEKRAAAACNHPFIISLEYSFQTEALAIMVLKLGTGGDLNDALKACGGKLDEVRVQFYTAELVLALSHMHNLGLIYRDLKPGNVLLNQDGHIKLVDMGAVADVDGETLTQSTKEGPTEKPIRSPVFGRKSISIANGSSKNIRSGSISMAGQQGAGAAQDLADKLAVLQQAAEHKQRNCSNSFSSEPDLNKPIATGVGDNMSFDLAALNASLAMNGAGNAAGGGSFMGAPAGTSAAPPGTLAQSAKIPMTSACGNGIESATNVPLGMYDVVEEDPLKVGKLKRAKSIIGTFGYMAPEMVIILSQFAHEVVGYTASVDWWSLGVCMYKMLCATRPFDEHSMTRLIALAPPHHGTYEFSRKYAILFQEVDFTGHDVSPECQNMIRQFLDVNPDTRLGSGTHGHRNIKEHKFFSTIDWNKLQEKLVEPPYLPNQEKIESVPRYDSFNDMMTRLNRQKWLQLIPHPSLQVHFEDWNYTSTRTLKNECGVADAMAKTSALLGVKFTSKKLSQGISRANQFLVGGYNTRHVNTYQNRPSKNNKRFSVLATIPSVSNMPGAMVRALSKRVLGQSSGDLASSKYSVDESEEGEKEENEIEGGGGFYGGGAGSEKRVMLKGSAPSMMLSIRNLLGGGSGKNRSGKRSGSGKVSPALQPAATSSPAKTRQINVAPK